MSAILTAKGLAAGHAGRLLFSGLDVVIALPAGPAVIGRRQCAAQLLPSDTDIT